MTPRIETQAFEWRDPLAQTFLAQHGYVVVRELMTAVEYACIVCEGGRILACHLPEEILEGPAEELDQTVNALIGYEILLILLGVLTAAGLGTLLVRRQLRPLNEVAETAHAVAELPLGLGDADGQDQHKHDDREDDPNEHTHAISPLIALRRT